MAFLKQSDLTFRDGNPILTPHLLSHGIPDPISPNRSCTCCASALQILERSSASSDQGTMQPREAGRVYQSGAGSRAVWLQTRQARRVIYSLRMSCGGVAKLECEGLARAVHLQRFLCTCTRHVDFARSAFRKAQRARLQPSGNGGHFSVPLGTIGLSVCHVANPPESRFLTSPLCALKLCSMLLTSRRNGLACVSGQHFGCIGI